jgi:hypothetical protein
VTVEDLSGPLTISAAYLPPRHNIKQEHLTAFFTSLGRRFIVGGDFNAKHTVWGSRLTTSRGREVHKTMEHLNLHRRTHLLANRSKQTPRSPLSPKTLYLPQPLCNLALTCLPTILQS